MKLSDYRLKVRYAVRDIAGLGATPNPTLFIFQDDEIDNFMLSGVLAYSKYRGRRKPYTLALQAGVAQYNLPADWVTADREAFNRAISPHQEVNELHFVGFVLPTINGGPLLSDLFFDWYDSDKFVIVNPAPTAIASIGFSYYAAHTVDTTNSSIPDQDSDYVVLAAASRALDALAVDRGIKMQKYKIGQNLLIDNSEVAKRLEEQAKKYWERFEKFVCYRPFGVSG